MDPIAVQRPLFDWPRVNPIPVDRRVYVPVLLDRAGERAALEMAPGDVWERIVPLIQLELRRRGDAEPRPEAMARAAARLEAAVGRHSFYLDVLPSRRNGLAASGRLLGLAHSAFRRRGLLFIPVYTVGTRDQATVVSATAEQDQRGVAVRYRALEPLGLDGGGAVPLLRRELDALGVGPSDADLVLDLRWLDGRRELTAADLAEVLAEAAQVGPWRNVIVAGTSIPDSLAGFPEHDVTPIERREWRLARELDTRYGLRPVFADYGIQHPRAPHAGKGGLLRANLRYTAGASTFVARGAGELARMTRDQVIEQYRGLCIAILEASGVFASPDCCWGDRIIQDCATQRLEPGAQDMWRGVGTSHHLKTVTRDLANLDGIESRRTRAAGTPPPRRRAASSTRRASQPQR